MCIRTRNWTGRLIQGSSFWVGYKSQLYHYPLTEGAIVGEAAALLNSKLDSDYTLECEVMYKDLGLKDVGQTRADLVIKNVGGLLYTSTSPRDRTRSRMPSSA